MLISRQIPMKNEKWLIISILFIPKDFRLFHFEHLFIILIQILQYLEMIIIILIQVLQVSQRHKTSINNYSRKYFECIYLVNMLFLFLLVERKNETKNLKNLRQNTQKQPIKIKNLATLLKKYTNNLYQNTYLTILLYGHRNTNFRSAPPRCKSQ